ncbi:OLC1v1024346C1 [Oldenlandia corymbosa var. corymbosa]|uniref:OLC1v1024346C1 n=1 Tax=Oldenlandia corymbosa var. corymbosa TaxID=529605 RepID=A0AAV1C221_OLDCO|nr:OLC1v1024346C1 [Oldenlandia corymbosa var. corymbosa]
MSDLQLYYLPPPPLPIPASNSSHGHDDLPPPSSSHEQRPSASGSKRFDPSRMIGIIRRKALVRDLAAVYHAECLAYCQGLLEMQRKAEEAYADLKVEEKSKKETSRPPKRLKKSR